MSLIPNDVKLKELEKRIGKDKMALVLKEIETVHQGADLAGFSYKETTESPDDAKQETALDAIKATLAQLVQQVAEVEAMVAEAETETDETDVVTETEKEDGHEPAEVEAEEEMDEAAKKEYEGSFFGDLTVTEARKEIAGLCYDTFTAMQEAGVLATIVNSSPNQVATKEVTDALATSYQTALKEALAPLTTTLKEIGTRLTGLENKVAELAGEQPRGVAGFRAAIADETVVKGKEKNYQPEAEQIELTPELELANNIAAAIFPKGGWQPPV